MKNYTRYFIGALFLFLTVPFQGIGQQGYSVSVGRRTLNLKDSTVFVLEINRATEKDVFKEWKRVVEKNKVKSTIQNSQITAKGVVLSEITADTLDIYSTIVQQDKSVKLYTVFMIDNQRIDPHGKEGNSVKVRNLLLSFGSKVYLQVLERELEEKKGQLKDLNKLRDKNLKQQDALEKNIQKDSLQIGVEDSEIMLLKGQLQNATDRYSAQKAKIANGNFKDKSALSEAKSKLKDLDKERKGVEKEIQKHSDKILDLKSDIRDNIHELKQLQATHKGIEMKIIEQHKEVQEAQEEIRVYPNSN